MRKDNGNKLCHTVPRGTGVGIRGGSAPRADPLLFHSPFLTEKESLSLLHQNVETSKNEVGKLYKLEIGFITTAPAFDYMLVKISIVLKY